MTHIATNTEILQNWEEADILRVCLLRAHVLNVFSYWQHIICIFLNKNFLFLDSEKKHVKTKRMYSV